MSLQTVQASPQLRHSATPEKPWPAYLNLDILARVLRRSIFHPFIACLIPLCLRAQATPYHHQSMIYTMAWAISVCAYHLLANFNHRIANGLPREVNLEDEVVLITGGAGGLGGLIAEVYGMRGVSVAVLDVKKPAGEQIEGVEYYECDIGNAEDVQHVKAKILNDLGQPSIVINCAAAPIHGDTFLDLSANNFAKTINANFLGAVNILRAFLPGLIESETGGTFVTVSSVLAHLCPANLSDYAASKAALSALHKSLAMELRQMGNTNVKALLVEPGQLGTTLFGWLETPNRFFAPVVETRELAKEIIARVDAGDGGVLRMPFYADWFSWYTVLPASFQILTRRLSHVDVVMAKSRDKRAMPSSILKTRNVVNSEDDGVVVEKDIL